MERLAQGSAVPPSSESGPGPHPEFFPSPTPTGVTTALAGQSLQSQGRTPRGAPEETLKVREPGSPLLLRQQGAELLRRQRGNRQQQAEKGALGSPCSITL